jgi:hypothetical protein
MPFYLLLNTLFIITSKTARIDSLDVYLLTNR